MCYTKSSWSKYVESVNNGVFVVQLDIKYLQMQVKLQYFKNAKTSDVIFDNT